MDSETTSFGGIGWLILILLFFMGFSNGFGNGNGTRVESSLASEYAISNSKDIAVAGYQNQIATLNSQYETLLGFKDSQYQMAQCCCDIKKEILEQAQATRDLINANTITNLRAELVEARDAIVTSEQTQALLNVLAPRASVYGFIG